jgi:hypothetical protein
MGVLAKIGARKALLRDGEWRSADRGLERELNAATQAWIEATGGPRLESADPEADVAREVLPRVGGVVQQHMPAHAKRSRQLYFERRQISFDFSNSE